MRIVLINTFDKKGGAAIAAERLCQALTRAGVEAVLINREDARYFSRRSNQLRFLWERMCIGLSMFFCRENLFSVSIANTGYDLSRLEAVQKADIIHLHWVSQGFLSLKNIGQLARLGKPMVWTMHDEWPFTGICHHAGDCNGFKEECARCRFLACKGKRDLSNRIFRKKRKLYARYPVQMVGCSRWIANRANQSALLPVKNAVSIPNPIDVGKFKPTGKTAARERLRLPLDKKLLLFGAFNSLDPKKGIHYLRNALPLLKTSDVALVIIGNKKEEITLPFPCHYLGYISSEETMVDVYNAVDLFVTPSLFENLPNTIMEAMACGTPCVGFQVGGIPEMIDHEVNGYVARYKDVRDLAHGIDAVLEKQTEFSVAAVEKVRDSYSENTVAEKYIRLYASLLP